MDYRAEYQKKLTAAADAVKVVKSGDWVDYGFCANHPVALDKALADRMSADAGLTGINFRGGIALWQPEVTKIPDVETRITWNSWHTSGNSLTKGSASTIRSAIPRCRAITGKASVTWMWP